MLRSARVLVLALLAALVVVPAVPASAATPVLTLTANKSSYTASETATFRSHVEAMNLDYYVQIQYPGSTEWKVLCFAINVNTQDFKCELGLLYNMKVRALLIDSHGTQDDTSDDTVEAVVNQTIPVRARLGTTPNGFYRTSSVL